MNSEARLCICVEWSLFTSEPSRRLSSVSCKLLAAGPSDLPESIEKQLSDAGPGMQDSTSNQPFGDLGRFRGELELSGPGCVANDP